jgi:hypothetical protein
MYTRCPRYKLLHNDFILCIMYYKFLKSDYTQQDINLSCIITYIWNVIATKTIRNILIKLGK